LPVLGSCFGVWVLECVFESVLVFLLVPPFDEFLDPAFDSPSFDPLWELSLLVDFVPVWEPPVCVPCLEESLVPECAVLVWPLVSCLEWVCVPLWALLEEWELLEEFPPEWAGEWAFGEAGGLDLELEGGGPPRFWPPPFFWAETRVEEAAKVNTPNAAIARNRFMGFTFV
jgi:hypothetical protein